MTTYRLSIELDTDPSNPRDYDNLGRMACWHRRYKLGDEQPLIAPDEYFQNMPDRIELPLFLFDHSGLCMRTSDFGDPWDSGQVGSIYVTKERAREELGVKRLTKKRLELVYAILEGEVETYNQYLQGDVWGYEITDNGEVVDSCWGFYGRDYAEEEGKQALAYHSAHSAHIKQAGEAQ